MAGEIRSTGSTTGIQVPLQDGADATPSLAKDSASLPQTTSAGMTDQGLRAAGEALSGLTASSGARASNVFSIHSVGRGTVVDQARQRMMAVILTAVAASESSES